MKKLTVFFLCLAFLVAFAAAEPGTVDSAPGGSQMVGNDKDEHGCIGSAGYTWCEEKQKCLRIWEEDCAGIDAEQIGGQVDEHGCRTSMGEFWCEDTQKCFMIHQEECASFEDDVDTETTEDGDSETEEDEPKSLEEVKAKVQQRQQEMVQGQENMPEKEQKVYQNQNEVRTAVHALLAMEGITDGIGQQVSAIAKEFNNSIQATLNAEKRIERKSAFARFFTGGDEKAAEELDAIVNQNKLRIEQLKQLKEQCNCTSEAKAYMLEQIQNIELEQTRLELRSVGEKQSKGIFGWLWK